MPIGRQIGAVSHADIAGGNVNIVLICAALISGDDCHVEVVVLDLRKQNLENGYQQRSPFMEMLLADPAFDNIRSDPRYREWLRRLKLEP